MGQRMLKEMRARVMRSPLVKAVTDEHIQYADGTWVDPAEHTVEERPCWFIDKLIGGHAELIGIHVIVRGRIRILATGQEVWERIEERPVRGSWAEEERGEGAVSSTLSPSLAWRIHAAEDNARAAEKNERAIRLAQKRERCLEKVSAFCFPIVLVVMCVVGVLVGPGLVLAFCGFLCSLGWFGCIVAFYAFLFWGLCVSAVIHHKFASPLG